MRNHRVPRFDESSRAAAREHQRSLTKPEGSLGRLEDVAAWYAGARGCFPPPRPDRAAVAVFVGDHGMTRHQVSAFPPSVTTAMVANMMVGGAAVTVMAERLGVEVVVVDVGMAGDRSLLPAAPRVPLLRANVRSGTADFCEQAAMSRTEAAAAMQVGEDLAHRLADDGYGLLAAGEMGIGNTTSAAALVCALTSTKPEDVVGLGTGISNERYRRKVDVVARALNRHPPNMDDPVGILAALGGLELAAMSGFFLGAAQVRVPVVVDGFPATAAALVAQAVDREVAAYLLASHASAERGAAVATEALGLGQRPLLDLGLRLGEGTGALLALDLVRTAVELQRSMATFASAGVPGRDDPEPTSAP